MTSNMHCILSQSNDPAINLAMEEYFLKNYEQDIFLLYINNKSIIVGKHQNTLSEINPQIEKEKSIPVFRRLSGGGTVFHDMGNINFCFITNEKKGQLINFERFTYPIIEALKQLKIDAYFGGRNDLLIEGKKISGNACHIFKNRVMHHGTLLYNSQLESLTHSLKNDPTKYQSKAVKSIRSQVTNIIDYLENKISTKDFITHLHNFIIVHNNGNRPLNLNSEEHSKIEELADKKYRTWEWNYGYSPKYQLKRKVKLKNTSLIQLILTVEKGIIKELEIKSKKEVSHVELALKKALINSPHNRKILLKKNEKNMSIEEIVDRNKLICSLF